MTGMRCGHCVDCCDPAPPLRFVEQQHPLVVCQPTTTTSSSSGADEWHFEERHGQRQKQQKQHQSKSHSNSKKINHMILNGTQQHPPGRAKDCSRRHFAQDGSNHSSSSSSVFQNPNHPIGASATSSGGFRVVVGGGSSEEYRSLHGSENIMPSPLRQRRGLSCLGLLQLPTKCTNVDPRRHKWIRPLSLNNKNDSIYQNRKDFVLGRETRARGGVTSCAAAAATTGASSTAVLKTSGGKRLRVDSSKPFMTGSNVGISYFLNPELSVRPHTSASGSDSVVDYDRSRLWDQSTTRSSHQQYIANNANDYQLRSIDAGTRGGDHYYYDAGKKQLSGSGGFTVRMLPPTDSSTGRGRFYLEQNEPPAARLVDWRKGGAASGGLRGLRPTTATSSNGSHFRRLGRTKGKSTERIRSFSVSPPSVLCTHPKAPSLWSPNPLQWHQQTAADQQEEPPKPSWNYPYPPAARRVQQLL